MAATARGAPNPPCTRHSPAAATTVSPPLRDRPGRGTHAGVRGKLHVVPPAEGGLRGKGRAAGGHGICRREQEEDRVRGPSLRPADVPPQRQSPRCSLPPGHPKVAQQPGGTALLRTRHPVPPSSPSPGPRREAAGWTRAPAPLSLGPSSGRAKGGHRGPPGWAERRGQGTYSAVLPSQNNSSCL